MSPSRKAIVPLPDGCDPRSIFFVIGHGTESVSEYAPDAPLASPDTVPADTTLITASHCGLPVYSKLQVARLFARAGECTLRGHFPEFEYYPAGTEMPRLDTTLVLEDLLTLPIPPAPPASTPASAPRRRLVLGTQISIAKSGIYAVYGMPAFNAEPLAPYATTPDIAEMLSSPVAGLRVETNDYQLLVQEHRARLRWTLAVSFPDSAAGTAAAIAPLAAAVEKRIRETVTAMCKEAQVGSLIRGAYSVYFRNVVTSDTTHVRPMLLSRSKVSIRRIIAEISKLRARMLGSPKSGSPKSAPAPALVYYLGCRSFSDSDYEKYTKKYEDAFSIVFGYALSRYRRFFLNHRAEINALLKPWITVADLFRYEDAREEAAETAAGPGPAGEQSPGTRGIFEKFLEFYNALMAEIPTRASPVLTALLQRLSDHHPADTVLARHRAYLEAEDTQEFQAKLKTVADIRSTLAMRRTRTVTGGK
jgi:hypothetical protein